MTKNGCAVGKSSEMIGGLGGLISALPPICRLADQLAGTQEVTLRNMQETLGIDQKFVRKPFV
jgi:hypothetical protein